LVVHSIDDPFERGSQHQRLRICGADARARVTFKAARFRTAFVQLRAALGGALQAAFERAAFARGH